MSRAYRIKVAETLKKIIKADDGVCTALDMLDILPKEQMGELLAKELEGDGYKRDGKKMTKDLGGNVSATIDIEDGTLTVNVEDCDEVCLEGEKETTTWDDDELAHETRDKLRAEIRKDLESQVSSEEEKLQQEVTDQLEKRLEGAVLEVNKAINRTTIEALKAKAAQIGQIKEISENKDDGDLTIVLEV